MEKVTFCIPSKSNLRYLKTCIPSIRENAFRKDHEIIVFIDADEDGTVEWLNQVKDQYDIKYYTNPDIGNSLFGIGKAYDYCIQQSTTDIFMIFHADMMLGKYADLKAFEHLKPKRAVCATRIEPPLHPNNGEKILLDFGIWPEDWKRDEFNSYVEANLENSKTTNGIFAPWMMYKRDFTVLGGHDPILKSCREDSDVFNRMKLAGYDFIQPWNSLVYHLTGRGAGSFDGDQARHEAWKKEMLNSTKEFIRKWGSNVNHTELMEPLVAPKYDIGFVVSNCGSPLLEILEPWCSTIYLRDDYSLITSDYISKEQPNTKFDLWERIKPYDNEKQNEILVSFDGSKLNQQNFQLLQQLPEIIKDSGEIGSFQIDIFSIDIMQMNEYQNNLIVCSTI